MCKGGGIKPLKILAGAATLGITSYMDDKANDLKNDGERMAAEQKAANVAAIAEANKPAPTMVDPLVDDATKQKRLRALRFGLSSTVKTSPMGVPANNVPKTKLGQ